MILTYTGTRTGSNPAQWLLIDYFYVTGAGASGSPEGSIDGSGGGGAEGAGGTGSRSKTPVAAIAGGVVGGVAVLLAIAGFIWLFMRKRRQRSSPRELYPKEGLDPTPYTLGSQEHGHEDQLSKSSPPPGESMAQLTQSVYSPSQVTNLRTLSYHPATTTASESVYGASSVDGGKTSSSQNQSQTRNFSDMKSAQREVVNVEARQHQDSGVRYVQNQAGPSQHEEVPPSYTAE